MSWKGRNSALVCASGVREHESACVDECVRVKREQESASNDFFSFNPFLTRRQYRPFFERKPGVGCRTSPRTSNSSQK